MDILLALDHFTLLSNTDNNDKWIVEFIDNDKVRFPFLIVSERSTLLGAQRLSFGNISGQCFLQGRH
jgi:hypothetical protein